MRKFALFGLLLGVAVFAACGGSGTSTDCTTGETAAEGAFADFATIMENDDIQPCMFASGTCDCPNGGTMTMDLATLTLTFDGCTSATDKVYTGTLTMAADGSSFSGTMNPFGDCTNVTATGIVVEGACGGTVTGTCGGQTLNCTMADDGEGNCQPDCTC